METYEIIKLDKNSLLLKVKDGIYYRINEKSWISLAGYTNNIAWWHDNYPAMIFARKVIKPRFDCDKKFPHGY